MAEATNQEKTKKVVFTRNVYENGEHYKAGETYEITKELAEKLKQFIA